MHRVAIATVLVLASIPAVAQTPAQAPAAAPAAAAPLWLQDYEAARQRAKPAKLDLLLAFMAPDADGLAAKLEAEVFAQPEFVAEASKYYLLVRFDYPADSSQLPEVLRKQNQWLLTKYRSSRLPTVHLTDAHGRSYAQTGWLPGGAKAFLAFAESKRKAHQQSIAALERAATCRGIERAKALAEGLACLDDDVVAANYHKEAMEIIKLDADGAAGLKEPFDAILRDAAAAPLLVNMQDELRPLIEQKKWDELDAQIEQQLAAHQGARWAAQYLTYLKGQSRMDGRQDAAGALPLFETALAMAPRSELAPPIARSRQDAAAAVEKQQREEAERKAKEAKDKKKRGQPEPKKGPGK